MKNVFVILIALVSIFFLASCEKDDYKPTTFHFDNTPVLEAISNLFNFVSDWKVEHTAQYQNLANNQDSILHLQNLTLDQVLAANTAIDELTTIAIKIDGNVEEALICLAEVKQLNIELHAKFDEFGLQLDDIDDRLAQLWFAFNSFATNTTGHLNDIENTLNGVDNIVNILLAQSNLTLDYLLELLGYAITANAQLTNIQAAVAVNTGLNMQILQGQQAGFAAASAFYAQTTATLADHGQDLQQILFNQSTLQLAFNQHAQAAAAAWAQATFELQGSVNDAITAIAAVQTDVSYIRTKVDMLCALAPGFADQLNQILLVSNNSWDTVQTIPGSISALQQSLLAAIAAGFTSVDQSFAEIKEILITNFGDISVTLATLATGDDINGLAALITNGFAANQQFTADLINNATAVIIDAVNSGNESVLNAIGNLNTAMTNLFNNINASINDLELAVDNIEGFNNCCNACGQSAPTIINNTVVTNVVVQNACCNMGMPPMNGCD